MTQLPIPQDGGFQLDPALQQYMRQQKWSNFLSNLGQGMIEASMGGADLLPALGAAWPPPEQTGV